MATGSDDLVIDLPASAVPDGNYVVELMFAELSTSSDDWSDRIMKVTIEDTQVLDDYKIGFDFGKVPTTTPVADEYELVIEQLEKDTPTVKRYAVDVTDGNGLQIVLDSLNSNASASTLNGLRILNVPAAISADFDNDGDVDGEDFLSWQRGLLTANPTLGDADGDGDVDGDDLNIWVQQYGGNLQIDPDFNGDGIVDGADLVTWETSYGVNAGGDADGDGDTDGADFLAWQVNFHLQSGVQDWNITSAALLQLNPAVIFVSTTVDEDDGDLSLGDLSLREAIKMANGISTPVNIVLPAGRYILNRAGTEAGDASYNDLDITGNVTILGDGAGLSVIEGFGAGYSGTDHENRIFHIQGVAADFTLSQVTITGANDSNAGYLLAAGILAEDGAAFDFSDSAMVNNHSGSTGVGKGIASFGAFTTIQRTVFTANSSFAVSAVYAKSQNGINGSLTIKDSLFALNSAAYMPNVYAGANVAVNNLGGNLYDNDQGNFFNTHPGAGDHLGTTDYVVTTVADTFDHSDDNESLSLREAVDLANNVAGTSEVWLPAWSFVLTRDRGTNVTDTDVAYGDLDIKDSLVIRGVTGVTSVAWTPGVVDEIFDLLGDFTGDGTSSSDDGDVDGGDFFTWMQQNGSTGGVYSADADDDGDVDGDDLDIWSDNYGNTFDLFDVLT